MDKDPLHPVYKHETYYFRDSASHHNGETVKTLMYKKGDGELGVGQVIFSPAKGNKAEIKKQEIFLAHLLDRLMTPVFEQALVAINGVVVGKPIAPIFEPPAGENFKVSDEPASSRCPAHTIFQKEKHFARFIYKNNTKPVFEQQVKGAVRDLEYTLPGIKKLFSSPPGPTPMR